MPFVKESSELFPTVGFREEWPRYLGEVLSHSTSLFYVNTTSGNFIDGKIFGFPGKTGIPISSWVSVAYGTKDLDSLPMNIQIGGALVTGSGDSFESGIDFGDGKIFGKSSASIDHLTAQRWKVVGWNRAKDYIFIDRKHTEGTVPVRADSGDGYARMIGHLTRLAIYRAPEGTWDNNSFTWDGNYWWDKLGTKQWKVQSV